jgi:hypothetical protein
MKKHLATLLLAVVMGVLGFAVSGVAVAGVTDKPPSPPGQDECEHGNSAKPCKEDPQPDKGKDCEVHGNNGGVNEDHCKGDETTPTETTPTDTTPTETTTPTDSTPTETTPNDTTPQVTVPTSGESNASPPSTPSSEPSSTQATESPAAPTIVGTPPVAAAAKKQAAALGVTANAPKPSRQAQQAPLTL